MTSPPEVSIARRLVHLLELRPPIDIVAVTRKFGWVECLEFPRDLDVDGVCFDVKIKGRVKIFANTRNRSAQRIRFTLAHELGHVLIPWHTGSSVDDIDATSGDEIYRQHEREANRFASELLMPADFVQRVASSDDAPASMLTSISKQADVSMPAAIIRLPPLLPQGYIFAVTDAEGKVTSSGRSPGTRATPLPYGTVIVDPAERYAYASERWKFERGAQVYHWWRMNAGVGMPQNEGEKDWRTCLDTMVDQLSLPFDQAKRLKASVNAVIAHLNNRNEPVESHYRNCMQRFDERRHEDTQLTRLMSNDSFAAFVAIKVRVLAAARRG